MRITAGPADQAQNGTIKIAAGLPEENQAGISVLVSGTKDNIMGDSFIKIVIYKREESGIVVIVGPVDIVEQEISQHNGYTESYNNPIIGFI